MRVIAGQWRGRALAAPAGEQVRPTADRVREAVFSMLAAQVAGAAVLDLFAGSGALGIEALSRGAARAVFVDHSAVAARAVEANLGTLGVPPEGFVVSEMEAGAFVRDAISAEDKYDLVFLDPPYATSIEPSLSDLLPGLLASRALVVCESGRSGGPSLALTMLRERRYGNTLIRIYANS